MIIFVCVCRCWDDLESRLWWMIKTPILLSIFVSTLHLFALSKRCDHHNLTLTPINIKETPVHCRLCVISPTDKLCDLPEHQQDHRPEVKVHTRDPNWATAVQVSSDSPVSSWLLTSCCFSSCQSVSFLSSAALCRTLVHSTLLLVPLFGLHYVVFALFPEHVGVKPRLYFELVLGSFQVTETLTPPIRKSHESVS